MSKINDAMNTTHNYFEAAKNTLDGVHGEGWAIEHPEILTAFMQTAVMLRTGEILAARIETVSNVIQSLCQFR